MVALKSHRTYCLYGCERVERQAGRQAAPLLLHTYSGEGEPLQAIEPSGREDEADYQGGVWCTPLVSARLLSSESEDSEHSLAGGVIQYIYYIFSILVSLLHTVEAYIRHIRAEFYSILFYYFIFLLL